MNVLIAASGFREGSNYQETVLAKWLAARGFQVSVICAGKTGGTDAAAGISSRNGYTLYPLSARLRIRNTFLGIRGLKKTVGTIKPDLAFLCAPESGLPYAALKELPAACRVVGVPADFSSNLATHSRWARRLLKDRWHREIYERASLILPSSPDGAEIARKFAGGRFQEKVWFGGLPYDAELFYPPREGHRGRPVDGGIHFVTASRVVSHKPFREWLEPVFRFLRQNPAARYTLAGFDSSMYSSEVRRMVAKQGFGDRFRCLDLLKAEAMRELFWSADFSLWFSASITVQQSMGCGLPALIPHHLSLSHLVETGRNGMIYDTLDILPDYLARMAKMQWDRELVERLNRRSSADSVFERLFDALGIGNPGGGNQAG